MEVDGWQELSLVLYRNSEARLDSYRKVQVNLSNAMVGKSLFLLTLSLISLYPSNVSISDNTLQKDQPLPRYR